MRRVDAIRTVSDYTTGLVRAAGREPTAVFPAYMDLEPFLGPPEPLPERPTALFVGVLELLQEHRRARGGVAPRGAAAPGRAAAHRRARHRGREVVEALVRDLPGQTRWTPQLDAAGVAAALDEASRPRPAVALGGDGPRDRRGALPGSAGARDAVSAGFATSSGTGRTAFSSSPRPRTIAEALVQVLGDRARLERLAAAARPSVEPWLATPEQYAESLAALAA